jgi:hypothetical protein
MPSDQAKKKKKVWLIYLPVRKSKGKNVGEGRSGKGETSDEKMEKGPQSDDNKSGAVTHTF